MFWRTARQGPGARLFWAYIAVVVAIAILNPGIAAVAATRGSQTDPAATDAAPPPATEVVAEEAAPAGGAVLGSPPEASLVDSPATPEPTIEAADAVAAAGGNLCVPIEKHEHGSIKVFKYEDANGNQTKDHGEQMLSGWEFELYGEHGLVGSGSTDGNGELVFGDLEPGEYDVTEVLQDGWQNTTGLTVHVQLGADDVGAAGGECEKPAKEAWFGNREDEHSREKGSIKVFKYEDANGNKTKDPGEQMLSGWEFELYGEHGLVDSGSTDGNGELVFGDLEPGEYDVTETLQDGWENTTGLTVHVHLGGGFDAVGVQCEKPKAEEAWFGNRVKEIPPEHGSIKVFKYEDANGNKTKDPGEQMLSGWEFELYGEHGLVDSGSTDGNGELVFGDLEPGEYDVTETLQDGWENTTGLTVHVHLGGGFDAVGVQCEKPKAEEAWFGNRVKECPPEHGSIKVFKYEDANGNKTKDPGEQMLSGWEFELYGEHGLVDSGSTDGNGELVFGDLEPGEYDVTETLQDGWENTTGLTVHVHLGGGFDAVGVQCEKPKAEEAWFGNRVKEIPPEKGSIRVYKYEDANGNETWDVGEQMLSEWQFELTDAQGAPVGSGSTDGNGEIVFGDLDPGEYTVTETLQDGWTSTTGVSMAVAVAADQESAAWFGNMRETYLKTFELTYPKKPEDVDVSVTFYLNGEYTELLLTGDGPVYSASVEVEHPYEITDVEWWADGPDGPVMLGATDDETLTGDMTNEFGYDPILGGHKFNDLDGNGVWGEEPGIENWTIYLYKMSEQVPQDAVTPPAGAVLVDQTLTGPGGHYQFEGMLPGLYFVVEESRAGWTPTLWPEGGVMVENDVVRDDLDFGNHQDEVIRTLDLAITKLADKDEADPGELVTYTLTYWNIGTLPATNFTVVDDFDERYVSVVDAAGGVVAGGKITWTLPGPLAAEDGMKTIVYTVRVITEMPEGTTNVDNVVVISHPEDTNLSNNTDDERVVVEEPYLPFTGGEYIMLLGAALVAAVLGLLLRLRSDRAA